MQRICLDHIEMGFFSRGAREHNIDVIRMLHAHPAPPVGTNHIF